MFVIRYARGNIRTNGWSCLKLEHFMHRENDQIVAVPKDYINTWDE